MGVEAGEWGKEGGGDVGIGGGERGSGQGMEVGYW